MDTTHGSKVLLVAARRVIGVHKMLHAVPNIIKVMAWYIAVAAVLMCNGLSFAQFFLAPHFLAAVFACAIGSAIQIQLIQWGWKEVLKMMEGCNNQLLEFLFHVTALVYACGAIASFPMLVVTFVEHTELLMKEL